ncbi:hypothetical protein D3C87_1188140 [compost metagenome]
MRQTLLKKIKIVCPLAVAALMLLGTVSFAQPASKNVIRTNRKAVVAVQAAVPKSWSIPITVETGSTLHTENSYEREAQTALAIAPSVKLTKSLSLATAVTIYKEQTGAGNSGFDNTPIGLSYRLALTPRVSWTNRMAVILPTNRTLQDESTYQGAGAIGTNIAFDDLFLHSSLSYSVSFTRNVHELQQNYKGSFNIRENVTQGLNHSLPLGRDWSFDTSFVYTYGWTYLDDSRSKFYAGVNLNWNFLKDWTASLGTSNEGNALKPNGSDSNIEFYNDNSSVVKFSLTYVL